MTTNKLPDALCDELDRISTVSDRIRLLDRNGFERAEIARLLGKRYQHVRNVLEGDRARAAGRDDIIVPGPTEVFSLDVSEKGMLHLPPELTKGLEIDGGGVLSARLENGQLTMVEPVVALRRVQEALRPLANKLKAEGRSIVDELIAERREEAAREADR